MGALYTDSNPDLRKFKAAGGKLIVAQGGNDTLEIPGAIFDYYDTVTRIMGGSASTLDLSLIHIYVRRSVGTENGCVLLQGAPSAAKKIKPPATLHDLRRSCSSRPCI